MASTIHLDASIFDIAGTDRVPLVGDFSAKSLGEALVEEWVPYFECHKCGRFDYCKFAKPHPANPARSIDIKCGVAVAAIRSLVERCFGLLEAGTPEDRQHFLDGAFHFFSFTIKAEIQIGNFLDAGIMNYWSMYAPRLFGQLTSLREHLDAVALHLGRFQETGAQRTIVLVEGDTERAFIETLKQSGLVAMTRLHVRSYRGQGNSRPKRIQMLLEDYRAVGRTVYLQGDADGKPVGNIFSELIRKGLVSAANTFVFRFDFETAIPPMLLHAALQRMGELSATKRSDFVDAVKGPPVSVGVTLASRFGLDLQPLKVELAQTLADLLNHSSLWSDDDFMATELGSFLRFLQLVA